LQRVRLPSGEDWAEPGFLQNFGNLRPPIPLNFDLTVLYGATSTQAFIFLANCSFSGKPIPTKFLTTVTVLPPRPAFCRTISTRPRLFRTGSASARGSVPARESRDSAGKPLFDKESKGWL